MRSAKGLLVLCCMLAGCSSMEPRMQSQANSFSRQVSQLTDSYNLAHGTHYPVPKLQIDSSGMTQSVIGAAAYSSWTIHLNAEWVEKDVCIVNQEALPHELAHLFVYDDKYGPPQTAMLPTPLGLKLVAMNGPGLRDLSEDHGLAWQTKARALGADPCKEGYCYSPLPYKTHPLHCELGASVVSR
jgi:hypothetical protein